MSSQDVTTLVDMGFPKPKVERALEVTGNQGIEPAMEWLLAHADEPLPECEPAASQNAALPVVKEPEGGNGDKMEVDSNKTEENETTAVAKSLKCDECGRLFKTELEIEFHAAKSGHSSFSESTEEKRPLSEEEKKEQLRKLEEKMKQKRLEREENDKLEALEREKFRIRAGKEMVAAKKKLEEDEIKKLVEQRKREKIEEKMARQRVKDQIEQDKIARRAKFGMTPSSEKPPAAPEPTPSPALQPLQKNYSQTKLQIRLTNGTALTQTFGSKEQLSAVRLFVQMNRTDGSGPFSLMTNFPKKIFAEEDYDQSLELLGLVPSAVVIVSRAQSQQYLP